MTGYGKGEVGEGRHTFIVDIRSLNGKIGDIRIKTPVALGNREIDMRKAIQDGAVRGKIDVSIEIQGNPLADTGVGNGETIRGYFTALKEIFGDLRVSDDSIFQAVIRLPNVLQSSNGALGDREWLSILQALQLALEDLAEHRRIEGEMLRNDLITRIHEILHLLGEVDAQEHDRQLAFRQRLTQKVGELMQEGLDANRLEQEMLYYLDKLDVNEEKVRLRQHCQYFIEILDNDDTVVGKKLNFISQEIGREMNTLGAKAQWTTIQHHVVAMKNALEEIKEQLANVL